MQTALVVGATGYTGRALVKLLCGRDVQTVAHVRPDSPHLDEARGRFDAIGATVDTTPWDLESMRATITRIRPAVIYCLIGTTLARARKARRSGVDAGHVAVDFGLTALLVTAAARSGVRPRIVYVSALGASASGRGGYMKARWQSEQVVRECGLPYVIARPSFISGPDREELRPLERVAARVTDAAVGLSVLLGLGESLAHLRSMTSDELAEVLVNAAGDQSHDALILEGGSLLAYRSRTPSGRFVGV
jgi:uncharacterized protein YbjT (DUF2867 family)